MMMIADGVYLDAWMGMSSSARRCDVSLVFVNNVSFLIA